MRWIQALTCNCKFNDLKISLGDDSLKEEVCDN